MLPHGSTRPVSVTGRPISSDDTRPPNFLPTSTHEPLFFLLNSYTAGLSPAVMEYLLGVLVGKKFGGRVSSDEIGLPVTETGLVLPCGSTAVWQAE